MGTVPIQPVDDRGAISRWISYLFGSKWPASLRKAGKLIKVLMGLAASGAIESSQVNAIHWPFLSNVWPHLLAASVLLTPIISSYLDSGGKNGNSEE